MRPPSLLHLQASAVHLFDQLRKPTSSCWLLSSLRPSPQHRGWWYLHFLLRGHLSHPALLVTLFFFCPSGKVSLKPISPLSRCLSWSTTGERFSFQLMADFQSGPRPPPFWSWAPSSLYACRYLHPFDSMLEKLSFSPHKHFRIFFFLLPARVIIQTITDISKIFFYIW